MLMTASIHATKDDPFEVEVKQAAAATWINIGPVTLFVPNVAAVRTLAVDLLAATDNIT